MYTGFAMNSQSHFYFIILQMKAFFAACRYCARSQRHSQGFYVFYCFFCYSFYFIKLKTVFGRCTADLVNQHCSRHPSSSYGICTVLHRYIIIYYYLFHFYIFHFCHFCCHFKVHNVSAVIFYYKKHSFF